MYSIEEGILKVGERKLFGTGIALEIPKGYAGFINPRSGLAINEGITVLNSDGVIDSGFRGEIKVILINLGDKPYKIKAKDKIAQLIIQKVELVRLYEVDKLIDTQRNNQGFGHSGK